MKAGTCFFVLALFVMLVLSLMFFMRQSVLNEVVILEAGEGETVSFTTARNLNHFTVDGDKLWNFEAASQKDFHDIEHSNFAPYKTQPNFGWVGDRYLGIAGGERFSLSLVRYELVAENDKPIDVKIKANGPLVVKLTYDKRMKLAEQCLTAITHLFLAALLMGFVFVKFKQAEKA